MMASVMKTDKGRPPTAGSVAYATASETLKIPQTPLESRQGYHPKSEEQLKWRGPPTRQLTRQRRVEYESDIRERFYDDYIGDRNTGDAGNIVQTNLAKMKFHPDYYRTNAYQGLIYDPMRPVPAGLDFKVALAAERERQRSRQYQRRLSDSFLSVGRPGTASRQVYDMTQLEPLEVHRQQVAGLPPLSSTSSQQDRPRSSLQKSLDESLNPEVVQGVEHWLSNASSKEKEVATNFLRTISSHGKRPDPASKASLHRTRVRSAVMTPSRKMRAEEKTAYNEYQRLSKRVEQPERDLSEQERAGASYRRRRSNSNEKITKGSMFNATKQIPSHYTIHPDWASETTKATHK